MQELMQPQELVQELAQPQELVQELEELVSSPCPWLRHCSVPELAVSCSLPYVTAVAILGAIRGGKSGVRAGSRGPGAPPNTPYSSTFHRLQNC